MYALLCTVYVFYQLGMASALQTSMAKPIEPTYLTCWVFTSKGNPYSNTNSNCIDLHIL